ncbi:hypothetical protein QQX98_005219 [Neonectria punicea]|uniref:Mid2 domain-containing protein n=1 Tax=Neonectria punicea TaxID=979145 RepID=A0ABR1H689_9HYPO
MVKRAVMPKRCTSLMVHSGSNVCYSVFLYQSLDDETPHSLYACDSVSRDITLYAETTSSGESSTSAESAASEESTTTSSDFSVASSTSTSTSSTTDSSESSTVSSSSSSSSSNSDSDSGSSRDRAWIAGPVVGGIAGVVIIALLIWIATLLRKRRQQSSGQTSTPGQTPAVFYPQYQQQPPPGWVGQVPPQQFYPQGQAPAQVQYASNPLSSPQAELHGASLPTELQAENKDEAAKHV